MSSYERWILDDADYRAIFNPPRPQPYKRGLLNHQAKLSPADVVAIRAEYDEGRKVAAIANKYGVAKSTVTRIGKRQQQRFVP